MDAGRAHKVETLYQAALEVETAERPAFLQAKCGSDESLRQEVESLLLHDANAGNFLSAPAAAMVASRALPAAGERVGCYDIIEKLGEGGMGVVYKARDTRLNRLVAIKFSSSLLNPRFEREARAVAALNHPNICALYDIGPDYLVMEYVDGKPLSGPLSVEEALRYAIQMAAGLEAAHEKGIVHRDLKPANVKATAEGVVKLLDFGLAKAAEPSPAGAQAATRTGMILGTAAYMAPEQVRGIAVDKRADIWAFGVVLYEMLCGDSPFGAETAGDEIAAVITREPDWRKLPNATPSQVRRLLERCLRKDPKERLRDISDARLLLDDARAQPEARASRSRSARAWLPWAVAALAGVIASAAWLRPTYRPADPVAMRFPLAFPEGTDDRGVLATWGPQAVPSPDGSNIAFVAGSANQRRTLWVRPAGSVVAHRIDVPGMLGFPFWSPDSKFIGLVAGQQLKKVPVGGGPAQTICDLIADPTLPVANNGGAAWNADDVIVFSAGPLMRVPAAGGLPVPVTQLDASAGELRHVRPQFLGDGRHVLYTALTSDPTKRAVYIQELGSSERTLVMRNPTPAAWAPPGYLLFARGSTLFAQRLETNSWRLMGEPVAVTQEVSVDAADGRASFATSNNGVLVYNQVTWQPIGQLAWYDREGKRLGAVGQPAQYQSVRLSPDQKKVKLTIGPPFRGDTWIMDLASGDLERVTYGSKSSVSSGPWSPNAKRTAVNWSLARGAAMLTFGGDTKPLGDVQYVEDWSSDGQWLLCRGPGGRVSILRPDGSSKAQTIRTAPFVIVDLRFSPDETLLAYTSSESGREEIEVASYPSFANNHQVSIEGGMYPQWRKDGKELFFRSGSGTLMSAEISAGGAIHVGPPKAVFQTGSVSVPPYGYAATADGNRFLIIEGQATQPNQNMVLVNWTAALKQ